MASRLLPRGAALLLVSLLAACSADPVAMTTGTELNHPGPALAVQLLAAGNAVDTGEVTLMVDAVAYPVRLDTTRVWNFVSTGTHQVRVEGLPTRCLADPESALVDVAADDTTTFVIHIACYGGIAFSEWTGSGAWQVWYQSESGEVRPVTQGPQYHFARGWSPDGSHIVGEVSDSTFHQGIFSVRPDGTDYYQYTPTTGDDWEPRWSPTGGAIAFGRFGPSTISVEVVQPDAPAVNALMGTTDQLFDVSWLPDGTGLVFSCSSFGHYWDICAAGAGGRGLHPIVSMANAQHADVDPQGRSVAFEGYADPDHGGIYAVDLDGTHLNGLALGLNSYYSKWSPDGRYLAVNTAEAGDLFPLRVVSRDGAVTSAPLDSFAGTPDWSPDGRVIAFDSWAGGKHGIWIATPDGRLKHPLVLDDHIFLHPLWRPGPGWRKAPATGTTRIIPDRRPMATANAPGPYRCIALPGDPAAPTSSDRPVALPCTMARSARRH